LLQQQEEAYEVSTKISSFSQRLTNEVNQANTRLAGVTQTVLAPFQTDDMDQDTYSPRPGSPLLNISALPMCDSCAPAEGFSPVPAGMLPSADGLPDELSGVVAAIQSTNLQMRTLEESYTAIDSSLLVLQEGADDRDQQTAAYRDALLQLADDLELAEEEERQRAVEQARIEAELLRAAAEQRKQEEARRDEALRRELQDLVSAASAVQTTQAGIAVAETSGQALVGAPPIKVEVGVQRETKPGQRVVLVGSHPALGNWDVAKAVRMSWGNGHVWKASIDLPADTAELHYKAVLCSGDKQVWEKGDNHTADLAGSCDVSLYHVFQT
jgi:cation transport regulator ChaB